MQVVHLCFNQDITPLIYIILQLKFLALLQILNGKTCGNSNHDTILVHPHLTTLHQIDYSIYTTQTSLQYYGEILPTYLPG